MDGKRPNQVAQENVTVEKRRSELIDLIKSVGTPEFERELESEYQAQLCLHGADPGMRAYKARKLINDSEYEHFFEAY